ncbi:hypothetical protein J2S46_008215 [Kitasatospora herbaricolor]|nr:hypothetical protein [Kitasatospora herbaricolor]
MPEGGVVSGSRGFAGGGVARGGCSVGEGGAVGVGVGVRPVLLSLSTVCLAFGELDRPVRLVVREDGAGAGGVRRLRIDALQGSSTLATSVGVWALVVSGGHPVEGERGASASQMACTLVDIPERWRVGAV